MGGRQRVGSFAAAVTLVALVTALCVGCEPTVPAGPTHKRVLVVGDSLTVGAVKAGEGSDEPHWTTDAVSGRGTDAGVVAARWDDPHHYDLIIIELGTNDYRDTEEVYAARIDQMMAVIGKKRPVIWVDVDAYNPAIKAAAKGVNPAIRAAHDRYPNIRVGAWQQYAHHYAGFSKMRSSDGVHYTPAGFAVLAAFTERLANEDPR